MTSFQNLIAVLTALITPAKFTFATEKELQDQLEQLFHGSRDIDDPMFGGPQRELVFSREMKLPGAGQPDFSIYWQGKIAVEVKISGSVETHLVQLKRYAHHAEVFGVILICNKPWTVPETLDGKPCALISIGNNRL